MRAVKRKFAGPILTISLLCSFLCSSGSLAAEFAPQDTPQNVYLEGTYYGRQTITFTLSVAGDRFVKTYGNRFVIIGRKEKGNAIYYLIDKNKKLITKVSQDSLYRIGEFTNWNSMIKLLNLKPGVKLINDNKMDEKCACTLYHVENEEKTRICMNDSLHVPVYIEQNGRVIERTTRLGSTEPSINPANILSGYLKESYRYVDADEDISPDRD